MDFFNRIAAWMIFLFCVGLSFGHYSYAQTINDTLSPSRIISQSSKHYNPIQNISFNAPQSIISATGEADIIKYVQTLPGVTHGIENSSAIYVRGGNNSNSRITIDDVPIYGSSHLLGFASVYSNDIIGKSEFHAGGFQSNDESVTAAQILLQTKEPDFKNSIASLSASNFLLGGFVNTPLKKDKLSLLAAARYSPIGPEYKMLKTLISNERNSISNLSSLVYDVYGKLSYKLSDNHLLEFSSLNTRDSFSYIIDNKSDEHLGWENHIFNLTEQLSTAHGWEIKNSVSYNSFSNNQGLIKEGSEINNNLAIKNKLKELRINTLARKSLSNTVSIQAGLMNSWAKLEPGASGKITGGLLPHYDSEMSGEKLSSFQSRVHTQLSFSYKWLELILSGRINHYSSRDNRAKVSWTELLPEGSATAIIKLNGNLSLQVSADIVHQFLHTLEGIPTGWAMDVSITSDKTFKPEKASQYYAGFNYSDKNIQLSAGYYSKRMTGLIYFTEASSLFSSSIAGWRNSTETGVGTSKGFELFVKASNDVLEGHLSYTLSKTDRLFEKLNEGKTFPAKFDRRHVLNVVGQYYYKKTKKIEAGLRASFTYSSGHKETVMAGYYFGTLPIERDVVEIPYYTTLNNYTMPAYIRLDSGIFIKWLRGKKTYTINAGVYNMLNRHNPFNLSYNTETRRWEQLYIFPIMPSLSFKVEF